ncbi:MAG: AbrB/MazE/SpoVT family DNA-binding domain-containing protein [Gemmatimonadetes bacterium]|nr:AbrB/MazE/SpoVT family DNA-binding domain-containing protein [Gemmatimonadota bacterium]
MRTKIIRIGNSRGVRIPKPLLEEAGLEDEVDLRVTDAGIVIEKAGQPRTDWAEAAKALRDSAEAGLLDEPLPTAFDDSDRDW